MAEPKGERPTLASLLGKRDRTIPMEVELPTHPGRKFGLRPLNEREVEDATDRALASCRTRGLFGGGDEETAASLAQVLGTKDGREVAAKRSGMVGSLAVIATSELGYAINCEELALALCVGRSDLRPLVLTSDELRETLERHEIEWLAEKLEQFMRDRAPQRVHLTRDQIKEVVAAAKKGQKPALQWNSCAYSTLLDCVTTMAAALGTCGGETSTSSTPDGPAPAP